MTETKFIAYKGDVVNMNSVAIFTKFDSRYTSCIIFVFKENIGVFFEDEKLLKNKGRWEFKTKKERDDVFDALNEQLRVLNILNILKKKE